MVDCGFGKGWWKRFVKVNPEASKGLGSGGVNGGSASGKGKDITTNILELLDNMCSVGFGKGKTANVCPQVLKETILFFQWHGIARLGLEVR